MTVFNSFGNDCGTMQRNNEVLKSLFLCAGVTIATIAIYATFRVDPGYWEPSDPWRTNADLFAMASATKGTRVRGKHITIYLFDGIKVNGAKLTGIKSLATMGGVKVLIKATFGTTADLEWWQAPGKEHGFVLDAQASRISESV
jgi:hypothetical protein